MLDLRQLSTKLEDIKGEILDLDQKESGLMDKYVEKLDLISVLAVSANERLPKYSGSKILEEGLFIQPFRQQFLNRNQATDWALEVLKGHTIAAVDGSQVFASRRYSIPLAMAQAGLVINRHTGAGGCSTDYLIDLIKPSDFEDHGNLSAFSETPVSLKRHQLECQKIIEFMHTNPGDLIFLDGSLILSFINQISQEDIRNKYVDAIKNLLEES